MVVGKPYLASAHFIYGCMVQSRKIKNKYSCFLKIRPYFSIISDLKEDKPFQNNQQICISDQSQLSTDIERKIISSSLTNNPSALITIGYFMLTT
jgi:hypothetical protein